MRDLIHGVLNGSYDGHSLSAKEVEQTCSWIAENIMYRIRGDQLFWQEWQQYPKDPSDGLYLSLVYACCAVLMDDFDYSKATESQKRSVLRFCISLFDFVDANLRDPREKVAVPVWSRKGDAYRMMGNYRQALETYNQGLNLLIGATDWTPGIIPSTEAELGLRYSTIEVLYASKGYCHYHLNEWQAAADAFERSLNSMSRRRLNDIVTDDFPNGIRHFYQAASEKLSGS